MPARLPGKRLESIAIYAFRNYVLRDRSKRELQVQRIRESFKTYFRRMLSFLMSIFETFRHTNVEKRYSHYTAPARIF